MDSVAQIWLVSFFPSHLFAVHAVPKPGPDYAGMSGHAASKRRGDRCFGEKVTEEHQKAAGKGGWSPRRGQRQRRAGRTTEARKQTCMLSVVVGAQTLHGSGQRAGGK